LLLHGILNSGWLAGGRAGGLAGWLAGWLPGLRNNVILLPLVASNITTIQHNTVRKIILLRL